MIRVKFKTIESHEVGEMYDRIGWESFPSGPDNIDPPTWLAYIGNREYQISLATFNALAEIDPTKYITKGTLQSAVGVALALSIPAGLIDITDADEKAAEKAGKV